MKLTFYGAVRTVTGSMHLLEIGNHKILLECGLYQGKRLKSIERNRNFPFDPKTIDSVILSHAHIDHSGNLPNLFKQGFNGDISSTTATLDLCNIMLRDSAHIQERDAEYLNRKLKRKGEPLIEPLYFTKDAEETMNLFVGRGYNRWFSPIPNVRVRFLDAGHILGSAIIQLEINEHNNIKRLVFTGDLGRNNLPILKDPAPLPECDYLITESTYGNRLHDPISGMEDELAEVVNDTYKKKGKIIIPSFSVGRTQELVYALHRLKDAKRIPISLPIYVDSPLSVNATDVFRLHSECFDEETREFLMANEDPFGFSKLHYIRDVIDSKALNSTKLPCIIISASGMCEAGRILHHLKNNIENPKNTILIVSYQALHTLGRRLADRQKQIKIFGKMYHRKARIKIMNSFSAHADRNDLLEWIGHRKESLKRVFIVHGDEEACIDLKKGLDKDIKNVHIPIENESVEL